MTEKTAAEFSTRVVATREGHYNQMLREAGEVFDLLLAKDGSYKRLIIRRPILDNDGNRTGRFKDHHIIAKDWRGEPVMTEGVDKDGKKTGKLVNVAEHEDFAEDIGNVSITDGPLAGEIQHIGWMRRVPPNVPIGFYPPNTDFWNGMQIPGPTSVRVIGAQHPRAAKILDYKGQTFAPPPAPTVVTVTPAQVG